MSEQEESFIHSLCGCGNQRQEFTCNRLNTPLFAAQASILIRHNQLRLPYSSHSFTHSVERIVDNFIKKVVLIRNMGHKHILTYYLVFTFSWILHGFTKRLGIYLVKIVCIPVRRSKHVCTSPARHVLYDIL